MAEERGGIEGRPPDPFVQRRVQDPGGAPPATITIDGLLGDSDRSGRRRLYLNARLDFYVEFLVEDVVAVESIAPDQAPFRGLDATRVTLRRDALVEYVRSRRAADPFQVEASARQGVAPLGFAETWEAECPGPTWGGCPTEVCGTAFECPSGWTVCKPATCRVTENATCDTCRTCGERTCVTVGRVTCATCNQATCATCNQATCATCNQATCLTCNAACATRVRCQTQWVGCTETLFVCPTELQTHCNTCRCTF